MNTIKINIPDGFTGAYDEQTNEVSFAPIPKDIKERILTFHDVLIENKIDASQFNKSLAGLPPDEVAYRKVKQIAIAFNEGWTPDWTNSSQSKYYPWFNMGSPSGVGFSCGDCDGWRTASDVGSRLCFKSSDLAKHAGKLFEEIYKDFLTA